MLYTSQTHNRWNTSRPTSIIQWKSSTDNIQCRFGLGHNQQFEIFKISFSLIVGTVELSLIVESTHNTVKSVAYLYVDYVVRCAMVDWLLCTHTIPQVKQKGL